MNLMALTRKCELSILLDDLHFIWQFMGADSFRSVEIRKYGLIGDLESPVAGYLTLQAYSIENDERFDIYDDTYTWQVNLQLQNATRLKEHKRPVIVLVIYLITFCFIYNIIN